VIPSEFRKEIRLQKTKMMELLGGKRISTICLAVLTQCQNVTDVRGTDVIAISISRVGRMIKMKCFLR